MFDATMISSRVKGLLYKLSRFTADKSEILSLQDFKKAFDPHLEAAIAKLCDSQSKILKEPTIAKTFAHAKEIITHGGKRVRPYMAYLSYSANGGTSFEECLPLCIGLELFHAFALIHDDIIDRSPTRHGIATIHEHVSTLLPQQDGHFGYSFAILVGDMIFGLAQNFISQTHNSHVQKLFYTMIEEIVAGQMLDVSLTLKQSAPSDLLETKNRLKTSLYTFVRPLQLGALLAGASHVVHLEPIGIELGQAFQIQDDLLDIVGDPKKTGKKQFNDVAEGQHTFFTLYILKNGKQHEKDLLKTLMHKPIDDHSQKVLTRLFQDSQSIMHGETMIQTHLQKARTLVSQMSVSNDEARARLLEFIELLSRRSS